MSEETGLAGWEALVAVSFECARCGERVRPGQWVVNSDGQHVAHHHCPGPWSVS